MKAIHYVALLGLVFMLILLYFIEVLFLGKGVEVVLSFASLWVLGTYIKILWTRVPDTLKVKH